jgi:hypothetical protein
MGTWPLKRRLPRRGSKPDDRSWVTFIWDAWPGAIGRTETYVRLHQRFASLHEVAVRDDDTTPAIEPPV